MVVGEGSQVHTGTQQHIIVFKEASPRSTNMGAPFHAAVPLAVTGADAAGLQHTGADVGRV